MKQKHVTYRKPKLTTTARQVSKSLLNSTSNAANKAIQGLAKYQSETNKRTHCYINVMEAQQSINFILADIKFGNRRMYRENLLHQRLVETGESGGYIRIAWGWIVDYILFVLDLIWGISQPFVLILVMLIVRVVLIIVFTAIGYYILYKLITL